MIEINQHKGYNTYVLDLDVAKAYDSIDRTDASRFMLEYGVLQGTVSLWEMLNEKPKTDLYLNNNLIGTFE